MKITSKLLVPALLVIVFISGRLSKPLFLEAQGTPSCVTENGDVNGDGTIDVTDAIVLLSYQFLGDPTELKPLCESPGTVDFVGLPDTGHTECSDASGNPVDCGGNTCAGQDGAYETGCSPENRFIDNSNGTVTDNCTGLMWEKNTGNGGSTLNWCGALVYCEDLDLGGHGDWRLPNIMELQSIVDFGRRSPAMNPVFGGSSDEYWSSTSFDDFPDWAWMVYFLGGAVDGRQKTRVSGMRVRAVRDE